MPSIAEYLPTAKNPEQFIQVTPDQIEASEHVVFLHPVKGALSNGLAQFNEFRGYDPTLTPRMLELAAEGYLFWAKRG